MELGTFKMNIEFTDRKGFVHCFEFNAEQTYQGQAEYNFSDTDDYLGDIEFRLFTTKFPKEIYCEAEGNDGEIYTCKCCLTFGDYEDMESV